MKPKEMLPRLLLFVLSEWFCFNCMFLFLFFKFCIFLCVGIIAVGCCTCVNLLGVGGIEFNEFFSLVKVFFFFFLLNFRNFSGFFMICYFYKGVLIDMTVYSDFIYLCLFWVAVGRFWNTFFLFHVIYLVIELLMILSFFIFLK